MRGCMLARSDRALCDPVRQLQRRLPGSFGALRQSRRTFHDFHRRLCCKRGMTMVNIWLAVILAALIGAVGGGAAAIWFNNRNRRRCLVEFEECQTSLN